MTDLESPQFLKLLQTQDNDAFSRLVAQYHRQMISVAGAITGPQWAEEAVQDAWLSVFKALPKFEGRSSLKTWLFTIVKNSALARLRKEANTVSLDDRVGGGPDSPTTEKWYENAFEGNGRWRFPPSDWGISSPEAMLEEEQLRHCIEHTLTILKSDQRAVFTMRDLQQLSLIEICNILELSNSNVRVLLHRARVALLQVIERYQETGEC